MVDGVFGCSSAKKELRLNLLKLKRKIHATRTSIRMTGYEVAKYQHENMEITKYQLIRRSVGLLGKTVSNAISVRLYALKIFFLVWFCELGLSVGVASIAFVIFMTSASGLNAASYRMKTPTSDSHDTQPFGITADPFIKKDPIFTPKDATIILVTKEVIEGKIVGITSEYVEVIVDGELRFIDQKDISEIRRM